MNEKLNPKKDEVLLMRDEREGNKLKAVKGIDKKGMTIREWIRECEVAGIPIFSSYD
jgi:hypothetical protein